MDRNELVDAALGADTLVGERTTDVHIRSLREIRGPHNTGPTRGTERALPWNRSLIHRTESKTDRLNDLQTRIESLEFELAHQQRTTELLNDVVTKQTRELTRLGRLLEQLTKQLVELKKRPQSDPTALSLEDEQPPHY